MTKQNSTQQSDIKKTIIILLVICIASSWLLWRSNTAKKSQDISQKTQSVSKTNQEAKQVAWIEKSKQSIREKLKDPKSAQFKEVFFSRSGGTPVTCGQVNSKNSYGGYTGYQYFIAAGDSELSFLENEVDGFSTVWNKMCKP